MPSTLAVALRYLVLWTSLTIVTFSTTVLVAYTILSAYLNASIVRGYKKNRQRVFEKMALEREKKTGNTSKKVKRDGKNSEDKKDEPYLIAGFFHPYCNAGGGGERVLWTAIRDIQEKYPGVISVVYTGDTDVTKQDILDRVSNRFNINLDPSLVDFEFLEKRYWIEDAKWPRFTLIGQSFGSMVLGWEALKKVVPDVWIDTMGYAFTYPAAHMFGGCQIVAYVHYPSISSDMIGRVASRESSHNNASQVASSPLYTALKLVYYRGFAMLYALVGAFCNVVMANSSWTKGHIDSLWNIQSTVVYPPCDTNAFNQSSLRDRERIILSVAQFRPEKGHGLQLEALAQLLNNHPEYKRQEGVENPLAVQLVMLGSARDASDQARIQQLKDKSVELGISIGIHAMRDEHFGIGVVEYMAAGLIPVAHNSAGPKMDIVRPYNNAATGYLATTSQEFAEAIEKVLTADESSLLDMQLRARDSVQERFSEKVFEDQIQKCLHQVLSREKVVIFGSKLIPAPAEVVAQEAASSST
ncbi:asparagine-linked glycosylation protein [Podila verticillata]|nr:asparagine-linked glycosylation protein [Podila verticillata]